MSLCIQKKQKKEFDNPHIHVFFKQLWYWNSKYVFYHSVWEVDVFSNSYFNTFFKKMKCTIRRFDTLATRMTGSSTAQEKFPGKRGLDSTFQAVRASTSPSEPSFSLLSLVTVVASSRTDRLGNPKKIKGFCGELGTFMRFLWLLFHSKNMEYIII